MRVKLVIPEKLCRLPPEYTEMGEKSDNTQIFFR